jgi:AraC-like DNA-binding protein
MTLAKLPKKILLRQHEITADFLRQIDKHLDDIMSGRALDMYEIRDLAAVMHIHPTHLSNTVKLVTGKAPCYFFEMKIMDIARDLLANTEDSVTQIATRLTFDPSNFVKFFKRFEGLTPKQYREQVYASRLTTKTETVTI